MVLWMIQHFKSQCNQQSANAEQKKLQSKQEEIMQLIRF